MRLDAQGDSFNSVVDGLCRDCYILSGSTYLTYANESVADVANGVYNHHVFVADVGKTTKNHFACSFPSGGFKWPSSPKGAASPPAAPKAAASPAPMSGMGGHSHGGKLLRRQTIPGMAQIFGSGDDGVPMQYANKDASNKVGFYVGPKDMVIQSSEFINYRNVEQTVYITFDYEFVKGKPAGWRDGTLSSLSANGCMGIMVFPPANKRTEYKSPPYTAISSGSIYNAHAHLHDGGVDARLYVNGKLACNSFAKYGGEKGTTSVGGSEWQTIQGYQFCDGPIDIKKGDQIVLESTYDLIKHKLLVLFFRLVPCSSCASKANTFDRRPGAVDHKMGAEGMAMLGFTFAENVS
jgi:hypothetical protein